MDRASEHGDGQRTLVERGLSGGFGDGLAQAIEFVAAPVLFALLGLWLDARYGTAPVLVAVLAGFALIGVCLRTIYAYKSRVAADEEGKPWTRRRR
jgi:F0F1-type ATP synthase assembly protein I